MMSLAKDAMGLGLRALNRFAGLPVVDRLGLRKPAEAALYQATRTGFRTVGVLNRGFSASRKMLKPARLPRGTAPELFDLAPSEEQQMLRDTVQGFAMEQLRTQAAQADTDCAAPADLLKQSADLGISLMGVPDEMGGAGSERSAMTNVLVAEAMAQGDLGLAVACLAPSAVSTALVLWGDAEQQAKYLPAFVGDNSPVAALAILEPRALFDPYALNTRAYQAGGGYVLEGVKSLVPRAAQAELFVVAAHLEDRGPCLFIVESSTQGLSIEAEPAMGLRAASTARVVLDNVRLPASALLGAHEVDIYSDCVSLARLGWCALATGTAQAVLDYVIPYVNDRVAFGEPISHRQAVAFSVANIGIELEGMRLLTWRAAARADNGQAFTRDAALARRLCADKGMAIGNDGVQLLGGHGYVKEHPVERWYRDLRAAGLMEGVVLV
jgi:alkylation response protein AidB-like acyl-CoA dehydrogenase